jgi:hypothetical protein
MAGARQEIKRIIGGKKEYIVANNQSNNALIHILRVLIILTVIIFLVLFGLIGISKQFPQTLAGYLLPSPTMVPTIQLQPTATIDSTPTSTSIPPTLPPTWTPRPSSTEVPLPIRASSIPTKPILTQTPIKITPIINAKPFFLQGVGRFNTAPFALPANTINISWRNSGGVGESAYVQHAYNTYRNSIDYYERTYASWNNYYSDRIRQAILIGDAFLLDQAKRNLSREKQIYDNGIAEAEKQYQADLAAATTPFIVKIDRQSKNKPVTLVTAKGVYEGRATYKAELGTDYFFIVDSYGDWLLDITFK